MEVSELAKLVEIGKSFGLDGSDLLEFVEKKEKDKLERDERAMERDARLKIDGLQLELEIEKMRKDDALKIKDDQVSGVKARIPKLPPFEEERDNIDAYLQRFERFAYTVKWDRQDWAVHLSALVKGKALEVYSRLSPEDSVVYDKVKEALLKRFQMSEEGFRQKFRSCKPEVGETSAQFIVRLDNYLSRWIDMSKTDHTFVALKDLLLQEQFINTSNKQLAIFLKERKPKDAAEMARLADQYLEAHNGVDLSVFNSKGQTQRGREDHSSKFSRPSRDAFLKDRKCYHCGEKGHIARDCKNKQSENSAGIVSQIGKKKKGNGQSRETVAGCVIPSDKELLDCCTKNCQVVLQCGHRLPIVSAACGNAKRTITTEGKLPVTLGYVGDFEVDVLRDTGCSGIVVKRCLVKDEQLTGKTVTCVLIDGTVRKVPVAQIYVDTPYFQGKTDALCFAEPIYDLIIGNIPGVKDTTQVSDHDSKFKVKNGSYFEKRDEKSKDIAATLRDNIDMPETEECQAVQTRAQSCNTAKEKALHVPSILIPAMGKDEFKSAQQEDSSLQRYRDLADSGQKQKTGKYNTVWFVEENGLLHRKFQSNRVVHRKEITQLVVPKKSRSQVMAIGHESILAGHLGAKKTLEKVMTQFYWPGMQGDIKRFCQSCDICQKTVPKGKVRKVPLSEMPLIDEPFRRVAVDIVGPIHPMTERKNRFILTLVDYATRYPEATPLRSIDTEQVAESLVEMFSRVGVPREILTDQGSQFTSDLMKEVGRLLSLKQITTTPYHPMCNGLVERFNGTLKSMLRKLCAEKPNTWDRYIPALLFAYREAPQDSTGFSPFELLYGRTVRGPMSILRELWTQESVNPEVKSTYHYILDLRNILEETCSLAQKELRKSQVRHKYHFDKKTKERQFKEKDQVLILLPTDTNKLLMQWKGPYSIAEKVGENDYKVLVRGKMKVYHANLLKKYLTRENSGSQTESKTGLLVTVGAAVISETVDEEISLKGESSVQLPQLTAKENIEDVKISQELNSDQLEEVRSVLKSYTGILSDLPGNCKMGEHVIKLTTDDPIRSRSYPIPHALRETVKEEVKTMLEMGVIEPSASPYASPVVLVKKPDGSNRFCIDFRKLNSITVFDSEPMPDPEEIFSKISKGKFFTKIDLSKGYWQISVKPECRELTAFLTPDGLYQFSVMPFGLVNAPATFNRMMRVLLRGMQNVDSFLDDILIHTETWETHLETLRQLFERLADAGLTARPSKCLIGYRSLGFLGHCVGDGVLCPNSSKIQGIQEAPRPNTKKEVRSFLGLVGYYRRFVPHFATIALPLSDLTKKGQPNQIIWKAEQEQAFQDLKQVLLKYPVLHLPDCSQMFLLRTDASSSGLGAVLLQQVDGDSYPVAYASKKLLPRQQAYSVIEKECLAIVWAVQKFHPYLYGREFVLQTDHQPLLYMNKAKLVNSRIMRWALFLQSYRFKIESIPGRDNVGADYLSRLPGSKL